MVAGEGEGVSAELPTKLPDPPRRVVRRDAGCIVGAAYVMIVLIMLLALVPAGYADGVPRALSGRMEVLLAGRRRPVVGRVCMDQIVVDCGDDPIAEGAEVVLFGDGSRGEPTATEWAELTGTIDYEIVCGMYRPRVRRIYT